MHFAQMGLISILLLDFTIQDGEPIQRYLQ